MLVKLRSKDSIQKVFQKEFVNSQWTFTHDMDVYWSLKTLNSFF